MAGEVLGARGDALALRAGDEGRDVARDELGVGAEAAHADHRVARIRVRVGDGREVQVHAGARQLAGDRARDLLRQRDVVDGAEREVAGVRAAVLRLEPGDVSALLVDRDQELGPLGAEGCRQLGELPGIADVVGEEGDPAEPALEPARDPLRARRDRGSSAAGRPPPAGRARSLLDGARGEAEGDPPVHEHEEDDDRQRGQRRGRHQRPPVDAARRAGDEVREPDRDRLLVALESMT